MKQNILVVTTEKAGGNKALSPSKLIEGIVNSTDDAKDKPSDNSAAQSDQKQWKIVNKYYTTTVNFQCTTLDEFISSDADEEEGFEAVIFVFDSSVDSPDLKRTKEWMGKLDGRYNPSIRLAACEKCSSSDDDSTQFLSRKEVVDWGLDHDFEIVEICPDEDDYTEYEDFGVKRLRSALEAHVWPDISTTTSLPQAVDLLKPTGTPAEKPNGTAAKTQQGDSDEPSPEQLLKDCDDFDALFQKLNEFKVNCNKEKNTSSRIDYAEKVVAAFLNALGDEDDDE